MTNILIPTDFTENSLQLAEQAIATLDIKNVNIVLFHAFSLPSSEFDLLNPSRKKPYTDLVTEKLRQSWKTFKDQHPQEVQKVFFKFMEGDTVALFRNFLDANEIDIIFCPDGFHHTAVHKLSVDPLPLFKKGGVKVIREVVRRRKAVQEPAIAAVTVLNTGKTAEPVLAAASASH